MIGSSVHHYRIVERLGSGGMGVVYRAEDSRLGRGVALKFLSDEIVHDAQALERFQREAQAASALNHHNICTLHDIGEFEGKPFLVMELMQGKTLKQLLTGEPLPVEKVLDYGMQVADGLAAAHSLGITHRDIKPANIFITHRDQVKILDFGLAKLAPDGKSSVSSAPTPPMSTYLLTSPGAAIGTALYMSPEQARGERMDSRSDIFSCGVVLYEMATGTLPFNGNTPAVLFDAILNRLPPPPGQLNSRIPPRLEEVIEKTLEKDRAARYQSADELRIDLGRINRDIYSGHPLEKLSSLRRPEYNFPRRAILAASALLLVLLLLLPFPASRNFLRRWISVGDSGIQNGVAVLPFRNFSDDPGTEFLSRGLVETLASKLTRLERFHRSFWVVPATEVEARKVTSPSQARREFGVDLVVTCSTQPKGNRVVLVLELIDTRTLRQLASEEIEDPLLNRATVQDAVVLKLAGMLGIRLDPESSNALAAGGTSVPGAYQFYVIGLGHLQRYDKVENLDNAISMFGQALSLDSQYSLAHVGLAEVYWRKFERTRDVAHLVKARESCDRAIALNNQLAAVHVTSGVIHRGTGQPSEAVEDFQRALKIDPGNADAHRELAKAYEALGKLKEAEGTFRKSIDIRPAYWAGHTDLGAFYFRRGNYAQAESSFLRVIELTPDNERAYSNLAAIYHLSGKNTEGIKMAERSLAIKPTGEAYANLGTIYYYLNRAREAVAAMEQAVKMSPTRNTFWGNLGDVYAMVGDREKAGNAYRKASELTEKQLTINPREAALWASVAVYSAKLGMKDKALVQIEKALELAPSDANVLFRSVLAFELAGKRERALSALDSCLKGKYSMEEIRKARHLSELRKDPRYSQLVARYGQGAGSPGITKN